MTEKKKFKNIDDRQMSNACPEDASTDISGIINECQNDPFSLDDSFQVMSGFSESPMIDQNKLKCSSLASFFRLIYYFCVTLGAYLYTKVPIRHYRDIKIE